MKPFCPKCGSENVRVDASAAWYDASQSFEVAAVFDSDRWCEDCGETCDDFDWREGSGKWVVIDEADQIVSTQDSYKAALQYAEDYGYPIDGIREEPRP